MVCILVFPSTASIDLPTAKRHAAHLNSARGCSGSKILDIIDERILLT